MFAIIKAKSEANRDSVCIIDNKAIKKGDDVVLLGNKVKGQRIQEWEVAHIAPACSNKVDKWIAEQPTTTPATTTPATASKGYGELNNIDEAFRLVGTGNKRRDSRLEKMQELLTELTKTVGIQNKQIVKLLEVVRFGETSNPVRPAADEDNKPVNCLGTKTNGQACKQTQNRLQPNGFCGQHQGQSGDSERAVLDNHSEEVTEAQQEDRAAVSSDTLELLG
jgi:hypothetical protein